MLKPSFIFSTYDFPADEDAMVMVASGGHWPASKAAGDIGSLLDSICVSSHPNGQLLRVGDVLNLLRSVVREAEKCPASDCNFGTCDPTDRKAGIVSQYERKVTLRLCIDWSSTKDFANPGYKLVEMPLGCMIEPCERGERKEEE